MQSAIVWFQIPISSPVSSLVSATAARHEMIVGTAVGTTSSPAAVPFCWNLRHYTSTFGPQWSVSASNAWWALIAALIAALIVVYELRYPRTYIPGRCSLSIAALTLSLVCLPIFRKSISQIARMTSEPSEGSFRRQLSS